jgi:hypothetical protein
LLKSCTRGKPATWIARIVGGRFIAVAHSGPPESRRSSSTCAHRCPRQRSSIRTPKQRSGRDFSHATSAVPVTMPLMLIQARTSLNACAASGRARAVRTSAPPLLRETSTIGPPRRFPRVSTRISALPTSDPKLGTGAVSAGQRSSAASSITRAPSAPVCLYCR